MDTSPEAVVLEGPLLLLAVVVVDEWVADEWMVEKWVETAVEECVEVKMEL